MVKKKKKEDGFEKLARLIKEEGEETRAVLRDEFKTEIGRVERKMDVGFFELKQRLDETVQPQLDEHAHRIKILEDRPLSR
ncbi:hypothetical protein HY968_02620 [Candidatus Kaiserbacteria bacterium]|nr:hypothetical protein [Candidatus Kaiserbacteria bacterium]